MKLTQDIDNNACLLEAASSNMRKTNAKLSQDNYKLRQQVIRLEKRNLNLEEKVDKIKQEKALLDCSISSLFSDDGDNSQQTEGQCT